MATLGQKYRRTMRKSRMLCAVFIACMAWSFPVLAKGVASPKVKPVVIEWKQTGEFPHESGTFTQGFEIWDAKHFLETTGQYGQSEIRKVERKSGKVVARQALDSQFFGEGVTKVGKDIFQLTWREGVILKWHFAENSGFTLIDKSPWSGEGWGLASGGGSLWASNGTDEIFEVDPKSRKVKRSLKVNLSGQPLDKLNELEFIDGKIFANVWMSLTIVRINPKSGDIDGLLDLSSLSPKGMNMDSVANGLAWDGARKKLYVTGKLWPKVFELEILNNGKP